MKDVYYKVRWLMIDLWEGARPSPIQPVHLKYVRRLRFISALIDKMIVLGLTFAVLFAAVELGLITAEKLYFYWNVQEPEEGATYQAAFMISVLPTPFLAPLVAIFYSGWMIGRPKGATLGQRICDLRSWKLIMEPAREKLAPPSFLQGAIHCLLYYLSCAFPLIFSVAFLARHKRCVHDLVCELVILRNVPEIEVERAPEPMERKPDSIP